MTDSAAVADALRRATAALPAGEARPGQVEMALAVANAIAAGEHLLVQAGTGTGKSLGYLIPAILSGKKTVVATATKALQEQLTGKDLPFLARHLPNSFSYALLKGRSNYLCNARAADIAGDLAAKLLLNGEAERLAEVATAARATGTGDRADLDDEIPNGLWAALSVSARECPGKAKCAFGEDCFAERARALAGDADVIVVNTHLYSVHLASGGFVLPDHDIVIVDEAHALEDIAAESLGVEVSAGRCQYLAASLRSLFTKEATTPGAIEDASRGLDAALEPLVDQRVRPDRDDLAPALLRLAEVVNTARRETAALPADNAATGKRQRVLQLADALLADLRRLGSVTDSDVAWVARTPQPVLRLAPVDIGPPLAQRLYAGHTVILTSATLTVGGDFGPIAWKLGLRPESVAATETETGPDGDAATGAAGGQAPVSLAYTAVDVGSPFAFEEQGMLYCAAHLPDPRTAGSAEAAASEIGALIEAAGGRTLALFTSRRALNDAVERLRDTLPYPLLVQDEKPRHRLLADFVRDESSCLFATMGFWQGIDVPGSALNLVIIDRLPFPRPDDPLLLARREAASRRGDDPFQTVDVPRAATLLAQGVGRLIRTATDRGVVAVLDRRLATAPYRWTLVRSLPPLRRTRDAEVVRGFLRELAAAGTGAPAPAATPVT